MKIARMTMTMTMTTSDDDDDDDDDECVDLGGWQVKPRIVRIASIRLGESNSSSALGLESEFCDKPGNSYFCRDCSALTR